MIKSKLFSFLAIICLFLMFEGFLYAHPMPNSVVLLNVQQDKITGEIQLPLGELQSAIGLGVNDNSQDLVKRLGGTIKTYLFQHIHPTSFDNKPWKMELGEMKVLSTKNALSGEYKELVIEFSMKPPAFSDLRNFYFYYDVIVHQVITHKILISVKQDWQQGIISEDKPTDVGVIELDIPSGKVPPFQISLQQGSTWKGFVGMGKLGIDHISEGTDHLLFLLALLLPAMLKPKPPTPRRGSKVNFPFGGWGAFGGVRYSFVRLLKIVTAFTLGHSITLLIGSLGWVHLPSQWIEIAIAFSILISAIHAIRPIFAGREVYIASGFGLIHGLAFANSLTNLSLNSQQMALSILGFNIGIELMQLFIIILTFPFLLLLSRSSFYFIFRNIGAVLVAISAIAWMIERITNQGNFVTHFVENVANQAIWLLFGLISLSIFSYFYQPKTILK
jgi:HupE / UreJ protein